MNHVEKFRAAYAQWITELAGASADTRLGEAFASVPRERFVGPSPWQVVGQGQYITITSDDPAFLYQDFAVALRPEKHINNGQPSLHARCLAALQIKAGERVAHVGAGTGYYTAILARLANPGGSVTAYEVVEDLADQAVADLADYPSVAVRNCSGAEGPLPKCDVIYVSAGATEPLAVWLEALRPRGRLLFPLTGAQSFGAMLMVTKRPEGRFAAEFVCVAAFIHCLGARDEETGQRLGDAFKAGGLANVQRKGTVWEVKSLHRGSQPDDMCWFAGNGWWLSRAELP
jgi:protein-L-isoaspartate(D-aspartate) O-methyltransferase